MILWLDSQLSPQLIPWLSDRFDVEAVAFRNLDLENAMDQQVFVEAREAGAVIVTRDADVFELVKQYGSPPQVIWITAGNTSSASLKILFGKTLERALAFLREGEALVEIRGGATERQP